MGWLDQTPAPGRERAHSQPSVPLPLKGIPPALDHARELLRFLYDDKAPIPEHIEVRAIGRGLPPKKLFSPYLDLHWDATLLYQDQGYNIHFGPATRFGRSSTAYATLPGLFADLDGRKEIDSPPWPQHQGLHLQPSAVVDSGHGLHLYFKLDRPLDMGDETQAGLAFNRTRRLAYLLGGDRQISPKGLLRLPGTLNLKDPLHPVPCELLEISGKVFSLDAIEKVLLPLPEIRTWEKDLTRIVLDNQALINILLPHWQPGHRHTLSLGLAGLLRRCGGPQDQALSLVEAPTSLAGDEEVLDRLRAVQDSYARPLDDTAGVALLREVLEEETMLSLQRALSPRGQNPSLTGCPNPSPWVRGPAWGQEVV